MLGPVSIEFTLSRRARRIGTQQTPLENETLAMAISAADVRSLREKTGAPMMDCKKALDATGGDFEAAEDHLRKLGLKAAGKKVGRATGEGRCFMKVSDCGTKGALVAVACETDFVARTQDFESFLNDICAIHTGNIHILRRL